MESWKTAPGPKLKDGSPGSKNETKRDNMTKQTQSKNEAAKISIKHDPHALRVHAKAGDEPRAWAETILKPNITAALTLKLFTKQLIDIDAPITELTEELARQSELVSAGNLQRCEAMLVSQAQTLDAIFNSLAVRSGRNINEYSHTADLYMRLALKAQSQCRSTIEAIAEMKNPKPIAFVKQANIAAGNQQVNNGNTAPLRAGACAREIEIPQTKLLKETQHGTMDIGSTRTTIGANPEMEAVEAINRAADKSR